jgi:hypothetical protein
MYFGSRYYDSKISSWISTDPALAEYLPTGKQLFFPEEAFNAGSLKGAGGVFNSKNLNLYAYASMNPVKYFDPDGNETKHSAVKYSTPYNVKVGDQTVTFIATFSKNAEHHERTNDNTGETMGQAIEVGKGGVVNLETKIDGQSTNISIKLESGFTNLDELAKDVIETKKSGVFNKKGPVMMFLKDTPGEQKREMKALKELNNKTKNLKINDTKENFMEMDKKENFNGPPAPPPQEKLPEPITG